MSRPAIAMFVALLFAAPAAGQGYDKKEDVIYGRKHGLAMTMDVFTPKEKRNGAGVIFCVSGGWFSAKEAIPLAAALGKPLIDRGYTVFAVVHGSQPRFTVPEAVEDMQRAARYIRANASKFGIDPDRIGVTGGSAGGHLSLMLGTAEKKAEPDAAEPVERVSTRVNAVACFYPATDFFNWNKEGEAAAPGEGKLGAFRAPFDFMKFNSRARAFDPVTDKAERAAIYKSISPIYHVTKESAPALIVHGDADKLVPIYQSERMIAAYKKADVPCELVVKPGKDHGWPDMQKDVVGFADWFDKQMPKK